MLIERFAALADYLVINISSPNTPKLRELQTKAYLDDLLRQVTAARDIEAGLLGERVPLLVKLSPDLDQAQRDEAVEVIVDRGLDGIIVSNTTVRRPGLVSAHARESGGLSGLALRRLSTEVLRRISAQTEGRLPLIGVGGVMTPDDALRKLDAGATLVQVYTGLIFEGPMLVPRLIKATG